MPFNELTNLTLPTHLGTVTVLQAGTGPVSDEADEGCTRWWLSAVLDDGRGWTVTGCVPATTVLTLAGVDHRQAAARVLGTVDTVHCLNRVFTDGDCRAAVDELLVHDATVAVLTLVLGIMHDAVVTYVADQLRGVAS